MLLDRHRHKRATVRTWICEKLQQVLVREVIGNISQKWRERRQRPQAQEVALASGFVSQVRLAEPVLNTVFE